MCMNTHYTLYCDPEIDLNNLDLTAWQCVSFPEEANALIVSSNVAYQTSPLSLILYLDLDPDLHEFTAQRQDTVSILSLLNTFHTMLQRLNELPKKTLLRATQDPFIHAIVFAWMRGNKIVLRLTKKLPKGYGYWLPETLGILPEVLLDHLALSGYLTGELIDIAYPCPTCQTIQVLLRDCCPQCHHLDIRTEPIVHHFQCGYQASESSFLNRTGYYLCPKCKDLLKHFGMDYDKPGTIAVCQKCFKDAVETEVRGRCLGCHTTFAISEEHRKRLLSYALSDTGIFALFQSDLGAYATRSFIGHPLQLAPPEHLICIAKKMAAIERRYDFKTLMMECSLDQTDSSTLSVDRIRLLTELGRELTHLVDQTDVVTYHLGQFSLLFPGASIENGPKIIEHLTTSLHHTFSSEILQNIHFHYYPVTDRFKEEDSSYEAY